MSTNCAHQECRNTYECKWIVEVIYIDRSGKIIGKSYYETIESVFKNMVENLKEFPDSVRVIVDIALPSKGKWPS